MCRGLKRAVTRVPALARLASAARGLQQEHAARRMRNHVRKQAAASGVTALSVGETRAALRTRLAARAAARGWPKQRGDLHVFVAFRLFDWEAVLLDAFRPFGEVTVFEWGGHGFDQDDADWWQRRPHMNAAMRAAFDEANSRRPVDAVIGYLSGSNTMIETLHHMAAAGAAVFNFSFDDKLDLGAPLPDGTARGPVALASAADLNLTSDPDARLKYRLAGGLAHFHPETADPKIHRPYGVPFDFDITFVGAHYGFRPHFIDNLRSKGIRIEAFGRGWPQGPLPLDKMVEMYSRSRINLGFGGIGHSRRLMCLKGRDFEVPMAGGLYLTQHNPELELVFDVGHEVVTYRNEEDCAETIRRLLADPGRAAAIRTAGRARCLKDHTFQARWTQVFEFAGIL